MFSVLKGWTCRFSFFAEIKHVTSPLSSGFLYSQISRVSFNIFRISISITSTVFPLHYHVSSPIRWTCSALIPAGTESYRQQGSQRGSCGGGEVFCFECHCDSFGLFLSPFLHVCVCVCVCVLQSHCPVDDCVTAPSLTQRWASTCGRRIWISVSCSGNCGGSRGSCYNQSAKLNQVKTGIMYSKLKLTLEPPTFH